MAAEDDEIHEADIDKRCRVAQVKGLEVLRRRSGSLCEQVFGRIFKRRTAALPLLGAVANTPVNARYCPTEPFLWTRPPSKNRCCTMLWASNRKRTAKKTANSNFAIPNDGGSCSGGSVGFESVVIWAASLPTQVAVVGQRSMIRYFPPLFKFLPAAVYPDGALD
jgi:hypothetical protein